MTQLFTEAEYVAVVLIAPEDGSERLARCMVGQGPALYRDEAEADLYAGGLVRYGWRYRLVRVRIRLDVLAHVPLPIYDATPEKPLCRLCGRPRAGAWMGAEQAHAYCYGMSLPPLGPAPTAKRRREG